MHVCASVSVSVHLYPCMCVCVYVHVYMSASSKICLAPESCYASHINSIKLIKLTFNYLSDSYLSNKAHIMCNYVTELTTVCMSVAIEFQWLKCVPCHIWTVYA